MPVHVWLRAHAAHLPYAPFPSCNNQHPPPCVQDWWWKARLGKCYYQLGLLRDAERQFKSALGQGQGQSAAALAAATAGGGAVVLGPTANGLNGGAVMISCVLELCKIYLRMDQVRGRCVVLGS